MEKVANTTHTHGDEDGQPCWNYLGLLLLPAVTILCNGVFAMVVRHSRCFSSPTSQYMVSLAAGQIFIALIDQIPTIVVYVHGTPNSSGCFYLTTLDIFAVTIPAMHFLAILWHRLAETTCFQFIGRGHLKLPSFILPWLFTIVVTIAAITNFSVVNQENSFRNEICVLRFDECWIWIVPLCLDAIVVTTSFALWVNGRRTKNNANGISIVNRCSGDWTKSMALVFIDPNDLLYAEDGENCVATDGEDDCVDGNVEYTGLTVTNTNAEICDAILEVGFTDAISQQRSQDKAGRDETKIFQTSIEEEILEPDTNSLLLNDAVLPNHVLHHRPPPPRNKWCHGVRVACLGEIGVVLQASYVVLQLPYVIVNMVLCTGALPVVDVLLLRTCKWVALLAGVVGPVVHMCVAHNLYRTLLADKVNHVVLTVGRFNRYHRA